MSGKTKHGLTLDDLYLITDGLERKAMFQYMMNNLISSGKWADRFWELEKTMNGPGNEEVEREKAFYLNGLLDGMEVLTKLIKRAESHAE
jgi:hypothetical protein